MAACTADTTGDHRRAGLAFHLLPGFHNLRWMPPEAAGPHSPPYSFWFNADKALLPFVLIIIIPQLFVTAPLRRVTRLHWLLLAFSVPALLLLATALGGLGFEPHLPRWLPAFMLANLFFVSLAEEALFRGYSAGAFLVSAALCRAVYCSRCLRPGTYCRRAAAGCLCRSGRGYLRAGLDVERTAVGGDRVSLRTEPLPSAVFYLAV